MLEVNDHERQIIALATDADAIFTTGGDRLKDAFEDQDLHRRIAQDLGALSRDGTKAKGIVSIIDSRDGSAWVMLSDGQTVVTIEEVWPDRLVSGPEDYRRLGTLITVGSYDLIANTVYRYITAYGAGKTMHIDMGTRIIDKKGHEVSSSHVDL